MIRKLAVWVGLSIICIATIGLALAYVAHKRPAFKAHAPSPNVVLIILDVVRADRVKAARNGVPLMPNVCRFAEKSLRFSHAVSPCSWTKPTVASIFTSLYGDTHGLFHEGVAGGPQAYALPASMETMAGYLRKAGYNTAGVQTNGHLCRELGFAQGFDSYDYGFYPAADWVTGTALQRLSDLQPPFFLYAHYVDPHHPYAPPQAYRDMLGFPAEIAPDDEPWITRFFDCATAGREASPAAREAVQVLYDGEIKYMDDELGKLLDYLDSLDNTIVIIVADHGEEFWEHGSTMHSFTLYEEQIHVPLFIRGPGIEPNEIADTVETLDILPSLAHYLGLPANPDWQGASLFDANRPAQRPAFSSTRSLWPLMAIHLDQVQLAEWKLIFDHKTATSKLFNLKTDPFEMADCAAEHPDRVAELRSLLEQHNARNAQHSQRFTQPEHVQVPPEVTEQLESMGYGAAN